VLQNVLTEGLGVERDGHAQSTTERPAPLREIEATRREMQ
jgi:hypothetical protein